MLRPLLLVLVTALLGLPALAAARTLKIATVVPEGSAWIENVPEAIDQPGEWCFHPGTRKLTLWPPEGCDPDTDITVPRLTELLKIEGTVDRPNLEDKPIRCGTMGCQNTGNEIG